MDSKYTPGPWRKIRHHGWLYCDQDHGLRMVQAGSRRYSIITSPQSTDEDEANFDLIAAAPDLLSACEWLLSALGDKSANEHTIYAKEQARVAIAKAKGE